MICFLRQNTAQKVRWPQGLLSEVKKAIEGQFKGHAERGEFFCDGLICPQELAFKLGYKEQGRLSQVNFHISKDFVAGKEKNVQKAVSLLMDYGASLFKWYCERPEEEFPVHWSPQNFQGACVYFLFSTENDRLENEADKILGVSKPSSLVEEEQEVVQLESLEELNFHNLS